MATPTRSEHHMSTIDATEDAHLNGHSDTTAHSRISNSSPEAAPPQDYDTRKRSLWDRCINSEPGRLVCSLIFFAIVCLAMAFCNQFSDHRWIETGYKQVLLEDRGFDIFPA